MDKYVVYWYNGILLNNKKKSTGTCYNIDEPWKHSAKWQKTVTKTYIALFYLYEIFKIEKSTDTESKWLGAAQGLSGGEGGDWGLGTAGLENDCSCVWSFFWVIKIC